MKEKENTLVFLDEIQTYPEMLTLLKFLKQDDRFTYIVSGSQLGIALDQTLSKPGGKIEVVKMYQLDFEEFLWANNVGEEFVNYAHECFEGLPDAVNAFLETRNIVRVRAAQAEVFELYKGDASQYDKEHKLKIERIYELVPSYLENKKKRVRFNQIENKEQARAVQYQDEFDVGLFTRLLYQYNIAAVMDEQKSINLGTVYELVVCSELSAHGFPLFYYDNKKKGEIEFLVNDYDHLSVVPIEVKSGKDYDLHAALEREVRQQGKITYLPVYYAMFLRPSMPPDQLLI